MPTKIQLLSQTRVYGIESHDYLQLLGLFSILSPLGSQQLLKNILVSAQKPGCVLFGINTNDGQMRTISNKFKKKEKKEPS